jgi:hypothetical protein
MEVQCQVVRTLLVEVVVLLVEVVVRLAEVGFLLAKVAALPVLVIESLLLPLLVSEVAFSLVGERSSWRCWGKA